MDTRWEYFWSLTNNKQNTSIPETLRKLHGNTGHTELYMKPQALFKLQVVMVSVSVLLYLHMYHLVSQSAPTRITKRQMRAKFL
jgi:hypothetical protein